MKDAIYDPDICFDDLYDSIISEATERSSKNALEVQLLNFWNIEREMSAYEARRKTQIEDNYKQLSSLVKF